METGRRAEAAVGVEFRESVPPPDADVRRPAIEVVSMTNMARQYALTAALLSALAFAAATNRPVQSRTTATNGIQVSQYCVPEESPSMRTDAIAATSGHRSACPRMIEPPSDNRARFRTERNCILTDH